MIQSQSVQSLILVSNSRLWEIQEMELQVLFILASFCILSHAIELINEAPTETKYNYETKWFNQRVSLSTVATLEFPFNRWVHVMPNETVYLLLNEIDS